MSFQRRVPGGVLLVVLAAVSLLGCTDDDAATPEASAGPSAATTPSERDPVEPRTTLEAAPAHPVSLPALMTRRYDGDGLRLEQVRVRTDAYTQHAVTYRSGDLRISGVLNVPDGPGPFPALVLAHGYIDPAVYVSGQGLVREQDDLARRGYVVLHVDYRNHAGSDVDPEADVRLRLGYTEDVINAVLALRRGPRFVDDDRIGLLGRSMGGGVVYNVLVVRPGLVDAAVAFAPVSSDAVDNFDRWIRGDPGREPLADRIIARVGSPERRPERWREASPRSYFGRVTEPLMIHHGTSDDTCPITWTRRTVDALRDEGKDVRLHVYEGEEHAFVAQWPLSMERTAAFFEQHLRG